MATLIKSKSGIYQIVFCRQGKRIWRSLGTRDRNLAYTKFLQEEKSGIPQGNSPQIEEAPKVTTLAEATADYSSYVDTNFSLSTSISYKSIMKLLNSHIGAHRLISDITTRDIENYKNEMYRRRISPHTVNYNLRCIKAFFNLMVSWGILDKSPGKGVKSIRIDETIRPYLSKENLQCVLKHTNGTQLHDIILFAVLTGLRLGEIVHLSWEDILLEKRKIIVRSNGTFRTKSGKMRVIPISTALYKLLAAIPDKTGLLFKSRDGTAWRNEYISKQFKNVIRACKLNDKLHFHSLRHTFGSYLVESGVSLFHVQQLMGHSSPYVTQIYAHLGTAELLSSVERIDVGDIMLVIA